MLRFDKFEIVKSGPYKFVGKSIFMGNKNSFGLFDGVGELIWSQRERIFKALDELKDYASDIPHEAKLYHWDKFCDKYELCGETVGRFMKPDTPVTDPNMDYIDIEQLYIAKGYVKKDDKELIRKGSCLIPLELIMGEELKRQNEVTGSFFNAVVYPDPDENGVLYMGLYTPCMPKTEEQKDIWAKERQAVDESEKMRDIFIEEMNEMKLRGEPINIDLGAMVRIGNVNFNCTDGLIEVKADKDESNISTPQNFKVPLRIELRAKKDGGNGTSIQIGFGQASVSCRSDVIGLNINDLAGNRNYYIADSDRLPKGEFVDFEWIIDKKFMAFKINGEIRHIGNNFDYIREYNKNPEYNPSSAVTVAPRWGAAVTVESLRVTEL